MSNSMSTNKSADSTTPHDQNELTNRVSKCDDKYDDKYKLKCASIKKLIKEMIFYNGALDMRLKENEKEITKLKIQREFLVCKLIGYEKLDVNAFRNDANSQLKSDEDDRPTKKSTKKRVVKPTTETKKAKSIKVNKRIQFKNEKNDPGLTTTDSPPIEASVCNSFQNDLKNEDQTSNLNKYKAISIPIGRIDHLSTGNAITSVDTSKRADHISINLQTPNPQKSRQSNGLQPNGHRSNGIQSNRILTANKVISSPVKLIASKQPIKANKIVSTNVRSGASKSNPNRIITNNASNLVHNANNLLSANVVSINSHSLSSSTNLLSSNLSSSNSDNLLISSASLSNSLSITSSNHSPSNSLSNNILSNKNDFRIYTINQPLAGNQFVIKPVNLNDKNLITSKMIKNLNESDENTLTPNQTLLTNSFYLNQDVVCE